MPEIPASHLDLLATPLATLATVGQSGRPQLSTVCFVATSDGSLRLSLNETRQKTKNLVANPRVALHIQDAAVAARYLELRGDASAEPDPDYAFADELGAKYGGLDLRRMDQPGERRMVVTVKLVRVRAVDMREPGTTGAALRD